VSSAGGTDDAARPGGGAAIVLVIVACACFALLDTGSKFVSSTVPLVMVLWIRYIAQLIFTYGFLLPRQGGHPFATRHPWLQVLRGLLLLACSALAFVSLMNLPVGEFTAIVMLSPLVVTLASVVLLGERVSALRWLLVACGCAGALLVVQPGGASFTWAMLLPLVLVGFNAAFQLLTGKLSRTDNAGTTHSITGMVGAVVTTAMLPFVWRPEQSALTWAVLAGMALSGTVGHYFLIVAYARATPARLTPYLYFHIAFAALAGWAVFGHVPNGLALGGFALIGLAGAAGPWLDLRERRCAAPRSR
jgi:drug/metabolite transporter (DMT)-like permease